MNLVLGVDLTPRRVRMVLGEGAGADGQLIDCDTFGVEESRCYAEVVAAALQACDSGPGTSYYVGSAAIACSSECEIDAVRAVLDEYQLADVALVDAGDAAATLTLTVAAAKRCLESGCSSPMTIPSPWWWRITPTYRSLTLIWRAFRQAVLRCDNPVSRRSDRLTLCSRRFGSRRLLDHRHRQYRCSASRVDDDRNNGSSRSAVGVGPRRGAHLCRDRRGDPAAVLAYSQEMGKAALTDRKR